MLCPECTQDAVTVTSHKDHEPPHFLFCGSCGNEEWWTEDKMSDALAMQRDIERLTDPGKAEAWRRWLAGERSDDIRRDPYPDDPENAP
jgi:ribosomal protein S27AE